MRNWKALSLALITLACALWLPGCLMTEITTAVRYDNKSDLFAVFTVYEHLRSGRTGPAVPTNGNTSVDYAQLEVGKVKEIWENRDRLIPLGPILLDGPLKIFQTIDRHGISIDPKTIMGDWPHGEPTVSWEKLQIIPGKLYEDRDGTIGYWHEVRIPGSIVDELLTFVRFDIRKNANLLELLDVEVADRRGGKQVGQWADLSAWVKKKIESTGKEDESKEKSFDFERRLLGSFEDRSLAAINNAVRKGQLDLSRSGQTIRLKLPLTLRDAQGLASVLRQIKSSLIDLEKNNATQRENARLALAIIAAIESSAKLSADESGLAIEVDSVALLNGLFSLAREQGDKHFAADARAQMDAKAMANEVKEWQGGAVEKGIEVKRLLAEFNARKLEQTPPK